MSDTAKTKGYTRGREYLKRCKIEEVTFEEYRNLGNVDVRQQYKQQKAQDAYLLGWWHAGEQLLTLFKQNSEDSYQTQKSVKEAGRRLYSLMGFLEDILEAQDDDPALQNLLQDAYEGLDGAQTTLSTINKYLKQRSM